MVRKQAVSARHALTTPRRQQRAARLKHSLRSFSSFSHNQYNLYKALLHVPAAKKRTIKPDHIEIRSEGEDAAAAKCPLSYVSNFAKCCANSNGHDSSAATPVTPRTAHQHAAGVAASQPTEMAIPVLGVLPRPRIGVKPL